MLDNKQLQTLLITLFQRQEKLEKQNERFAANYKSLREGLYDQNTDLNYKLASLQEDCKSLHKQNANFKDKIASLQAKMEEHECDIVNLQRADHRHDEDPDQIAFSVVSREDFGPVEVDTNIPYEVIYTNVGGGWNSTTNAFYVSVVGVYMFTASMVSHPETNETNAKCIIVHSYDGGESVVASLQGLGSSETGDANSVILQLKKGDTVSVQLEEGETKIRSSWAHPRSTFSGFLLFKSN